MAGRGVYGQRGKNPQRKIATRKRWAQVVDLVAQNMTYEQVAQALGYKSVAGVHKALHTLLKENASAAAEKYRHVEDQRIEALLSVYMPAAMGGDLDAAKFVDALIGRRVKLLGANAPERAPVGPDGKTPAPIVAGVLAVPMPITSGEWDTTAKAQQEKLISEPAP